MAFKMRGFSGFKQTDGKKILEKVDFDGTNWNFNGLKNRKIVFWENFNKELILEDFFNSFN